MQLLVFVAVEESKVNHATRPEAQPTTTTAFLSLSSLLLLLLGIVAVAVMRSATSGPKHVLINALLRIHGKKCARGLRIEQVSEM